MRAWLAILASICLCSAAMTGQVVINEFVYDDVGTDDREFVELYNAGAAPVDISGWRLENWDNLGLALGSPHVIPAGTILPAGGFYVFGNPGVPNVNQIVNLNFLENDEEGIVLKDQAGVIVDAVGYELNKQTGLAPQHYEGVGIWGNTQSNDTTMLSLSRWVDGYDTDDNGADFGERPLTPGASNNLPSLLPYCNTFDGQGIEVPVPGWTGSFVAPKIVDPTTPSASLVNPVPASPNGGNVMVAWDPSGGGNTAYLNTAAELDFTVECYVYIHAGETGSDYHAWSIGVRGRSCSFYNTPELGTANGNTGIAWRYYSEGPAGPLGGSTKFLRLVDEGAGGGGTVLATIPIVPGVNDGWQRLRLSVFGGSISANFGGNYGNPLDGQAFVFSTFYASIGTVYMGFREGANPGVVNAYPLLIDRLEIGSPSSGGCGQQYQVNQPAASLDLDGVAGGLFAPAVTTRCVGTQGTIRFASTQVNLPWEAAISFEGLVPASGGGLLTGGGQIVNLNFGSPALPLLWLNGGAAPNVATTSFPAPVFSAPYTAPPAPGTASIQMGCFDIGHPDLFALSQACQLDAVPASASIVHALSDDAVAQVFLDQAPLCHPVPVPFYGTSYNTFFVTSNGRVMFGNATTSWTPSASLATTHGGAVGVWADYSPQLAPNSVVTSLLPAGGIRVDWINVPYFGQPSTSNTFGVEFDPGTGVIHLDTPVLQGDPGGTLNAWVGISGGNLIFAANTGPVGFGPAPQSGFTTISNEMIYDFGPAGSQTVGVGRITFTPNGIGNYDWTTL